MTSAASVAGALNRWARQDLDMLGSTDGHALECLLNDYFSTRKILIAGYYHILHELFINFLYNEAGTEGNKEENDEGFGGYFHPTDFDDG